MNLINLNGELSDRKRTVFTVENRSFRYGDGLFETIRMFNGKLPFLDHHIERLLNGLRVLGFDIPAFYTLAFFEQQIHKLIATGNARIRLTTFRREGGLYTPLDNSPDFLIEATPIAEDTYSLSPAQLSVAYYREAALHHTPVSSLKTTSALTYILAGIYRQQSGTDDCLLMNTHGRIAEAISSNIFVVDASGQLYTPPLSEGCVAGVMRRNVIGTAAMLGIKTAERPLTTCDMEAAEEVWLSNAISGIRAVTLLKDNMRRYERAKVAAAVITALNEAIKKGM